MGEFLERWSPPQARCQTLLKLEQKGYVASEWGVSDSSRKAKYYKLTRAGRKQLEKETREWEQTTAILAKFLLPDKESA